MAGVVKYWFATLFIEPFNWIGAQLWHSLLGVVFIQQLCEDYTTMYVDFRNIGPFKFLNILNMTNNWCLSLCCDQRWTFELLYLRIFFCWQEHEAYPRSELHCGAGTDFDSGRCECSCISAVNGLAKPILFIIWVKKSTVLIGIWLVK